MKTLMPSLFVSAALAGLLAAVPASADHHEGKKGHKHHKGKKEKKAKGMAKKAASEKVNCLGVNACKGKSECGVEGGHGCAGHNACKGQGWITLTRKECAGRKGTVQGEKAAPAAEAPERALAPEKAGKPAAKPAKKK